ncbi:DUF3263 domain-containing protein (plasmid) [Streptomyces sp. NBC_01766]|nr:DUF3263 domain-containing protein [Streptomyces sp. NBC_01766]WSC25084.1 DUF3263 domain-containing protein [Streptomyces sp. NBC_01766]
MHAVLALAARTFSSPGPRDRAIREELGVSPTRYFQLLNALLDSPDAVAVAPVTVHRLRRLRDVRRATREGHTSS